MSKGAVTDFPEKEKSRTHVVKIWQVKKKNSPSHLYRTLTVFNNEICKGQHTGPNF